MEEPYLVILYYCDNYLNVYFIIELLPKVVLLLFSFIFNLASNKISNNQKYVM